MANPVLVATVKGASSNAYILRADAQSYLDGRLNVTQWTDASPADKDRALIQATSRLEVEEYVTAPTTTTQRLKWPRSGVADGDANIYANDVIPRVVEEATCELALAYLKGEVDLSEVGLEAFTNVKVGPLDVTPRVTRKGDALPAIVIRILQYVRVGRSGVNVPLVRA